VGEVAALDLAWFSSRPLLGWRVAITRTREQASQLSVALAEAGAEAIEVPTIAVVEASDGGAGLRAAAAMLASYSWVVFTSTNAVSRLFAELVDARAFGRARVAAIGDATARALAEHGIVADLVPGEFVSEALAEAFPSPGSSGSGRGSSDPGLVASEPLERVLLPCAAGARDVLPRALRAKGYEVDVVEAYRTVRPEPSAGLVEDIGSADAVTFTSSSTVTGWLESFGAELLPPVVGCIGPITAATARRAGIAVSFEALEQSIPGLVAALERHAEREGRPPR
jgi:uroporphyrinogen III methyltransferase/synthase